MTPLDRAARALYERFPEGQLVTDASGRQALTGIPWDQLGQASRGRFYADARAVIQAIREPSEAMLDEGYDSYTANNGSLRRVFGHMIDALLEEGR